MSSAPTTTDKKPFTGSCVCKKVTFTVDLPVPTAESPLQLGRCNCTICTKPGFTTLRADPSDFKLLTPSSSLDDLSVYSTAKGNNRYFCPTCATSIIMKGSGEWDGQTIHFFVVSAGTIDQPQEGIDLSQAKISYEDMLNDNFSGGHRDKPWPNGLV